MVSLNCSEKNKRSVNLRSGPDDWGFCPLRGYGGREALAVWTNETLRRRHRHLNLILAKEGARNDNNYISRHDRVWNVHLRNPEFGF